jgi:hypothetical protein
VSVKHATSFAYAKARVTVTLDSNTAIHADEAGYRGSFRAMRPVRITVHEINETDDAVGLDGARSKNVRSSAELVPSQHPPDPDKLSTSIAWQRSYEEKR